MVTLISMTLNVQISKAESATVVINEIAWMGTFDSANNEWIELYNDSSSEVDLTGWQLLDDNVLIHTFGSGVIASGGYFLIEDNENALPSISADLILDLSLANTGDSLKLLDSTGVIKDSVNSTGGAWFSGDSISKKTMEKINAALSGDEATNWAASASNGGTPRGLNSVSTGSSPQTITPKVTMTLSDAEPEQFDIVTVTLGIANATDLTAYEVDLEYASDFLKYQTGSAVKDIFLSGNGAISTAFQSGLENGKEGKLVVAEARLGTTLGASGSGDLFSVDFMIMGDGDTSGELAFGTNSFLSDGATDITAVLKNLQIDVQLILPTEVLNLKTSLGTAQYSGKLNWTAPGSGADSYKIFRKSALGAFKQIGTSSTLEFVDSLDLIPNHVYEYQVFTVIGHYESLAAVTTFTETRGLTGDNNRNNRVDGRDLMNLANHYTQSITDSGFVPLIDTTYDGVIDGSDLIDIGANWAKTYSL